MPAFLFPLFFFSFLAAGRPFTRGMEVLSPVSRGCVSWAIGCGLFVLFTVCLGHAGLLTPALILSFPAVVLAGALGMRTHPAAEIRTFFSPLIHGNGLIEKAALCLIFFVLTLQLVLCMVPETANDSLCYQLNIPKFFAWRSSMRPEPYDLNSFFPVFLNTLYTAALVFKSVPLAKLFHWGTGLVLCLLVIDSTARFSASKKTGLILGLIFLLTPAVYNEMSTTYVDVGTSLFLFLSVLMTVQSLKDDQNCCGRILFFGGLFWGFAVGCKILILIAAPAYAGLLLWKNLMPFRLGRTLKNGLWLSLGFVAGCGFWFVRNWILTGNPFFPFLGQLFGTQEFSFVKHFQEMGPPKDLLHYLLLPFFMTFNPGGYDRGYWAGPFYLLALPFVLSAIRKHPDARPFAFFVWAYTTVWFYFFHNTRFLLPVFPVIVMLAGRGIRDFLLSGKAVKLRPLFLTVAAGLVSLLLLAGFYHDRFAFHYLRSRDKEAYLFMRERSWSAASWVNRNLPKTAKIYNAEEIRQFYFEREMIRNIWFVKRHPEIQKSSAEEISLFLKGKGFTHLLKAGPSVDAPAAQKRPEDRERTEAVDRLLQDGRYTRLVHSLTSVNKVEQTFSYEIYELL